MLELLPPGDQLSIKLGLLYKKYGYKKYRMNKFEPYEIYAANRSFLANDDIITFTDKNGRLTALRPDVTISAANSADIGGAAKKLYYNENVFRTSMGGSMFCELNQTGVEFIGGDPSYSCAEVLALALKSLAFVNDSFILSVSSMECAEKLFDHFDFDRTRTDRCMLLIKQKNLHELLQYAADAGLSREKLEMLSVFACANGDFKTVLGELKNGILKTVLSCPLADLEKLYGGLKNTAGAENLRLDLSLLNDREYYNGFIFQGYLPKLPKAVLSGGQYGNLMKKLGKDLPAVGFALYLGELERFFKENSRYDCDLLVIYGGAPSADVLDFLAAVPDKYESVRAEKTDSPDITAKEKIYLPEVAPNA